MSIQQRLKTGSAALQWLLLAAAFLLLGGAVGWMLYADYKRVDAAERERLATQAKVIDENLGQQLNATNHVLETTRSELPFLMAQKDGKALLNRHLRSLADAMPGVRSLFILDAEGTVTASNLEEVIGMNFREREYFQVARQSSNPAMLHISPPFKTLLGAFTTTATKMIPDERGEFGGLIVASLDPGYFDTLLNSVRYAPDMWTALAHSDGKQLLMVPPREGMYGLDLARPGSFFTRHKNSGEKAGVLTGTIPATGEQVMMALRTITPDGTAVDKTLVLAVARDLQSVFAAWRRDAYWQGTLFGVLALVSVLSLYSDRKRQQTQLRSEVARRASDEQLRAFYELDLVGLAITAPGKGWIRVNACLRNMLEYSEQELREMTWAQLTHPDDLAADVELFDKMLANEINGYSLEKRFIGRSGKIVPTHLVVRCVRSADGKVSYVTAMVEDITERKQYEEELLATRARLEATLDAIPDLLFEVGLDGRIHDYHSHRMDLLAVPPSAFLNKLCSEVLPPDAAETCAAAIDDALNTGSSIGRQYALSLPQGERWFELSVAVKSSPEGQAERFILIARDISERKRMELSIQKSEARFRQAFAQSPVGMLLCDWDGSVVKANTAFCRMSGYDDAEIVGRRLGELAPYNSAAEEEAALFRKLACGEITSFSVQMEQLHKDGHVYVVQNSVSVVHSSADVASYCLAHVENQTERKRQQLEALAKQNLKLQEAERARLSRELHDGVSQSLTALRLMLYRVQQTCSDGRASECLKQANEAAEQLMADIRDIACGLRPSQLDDLGLMPSLRWHLEKAARPFGLEVGLSGNLGDARLPEELELCCFRLVQEALTNVLKHARASTLDVSLDRAEGQVLLAIRDNGIGFDVTRHYLAPDDSRSLGLIGMRERVAAAGGRLEVKSSPGQGTEIRASFSMP